MAMQRPNVIVFQEYESITVAPDIPDLNVIVVGYAYQILDYLDDKSDCKADTGYGVEDGAIPVAGSDNYTDPTAVILSNPPNIESGALVSEDSVSVFFDDLRAVVSEWDGVAATHGRYTQNDNLFWANDTDGLNAATFPATNGQHFGSEGVEAGDILLVQQNAGGSADYKLTVRELCYTFYDDSVTPLTFITNGVSPGDIMTVWNDSAPTVRDGTYIVKRVLTETSLEVEEVIPGAGNITVAGPNCFIRIQSPAGVVRVENTTPADGALYDTCNARMNSDFGADYVGPPPGASTEKWRIERELVDVDLDATDFSVSGNEITINGALTVDVSATLLGCPVTYSEIYVEYMAQRTDLQTVNTLTSTAEMETTLGKLDARNPLYVGAYIAALNTTTPVKVYGLGDFASEELAYLDFIDKISAERDIYAIVPLTYNTTVLASLKSMAENLADPNYVLTHGIKQKFRAILGAVKLETQKVIQDVTGGASTLQKAGTAPVVPTNDDYRTMKISGAAMPDLTAAKVLPGDRVQLQLWDGAALQAFEFTISHYNGVVTLKEELEVDLNTAQPVTQQGLPVWGAGPGTWDNWLPAGYTYAHATETFAIVDPDGIPKVSFIPGVGNLTLEAANLDDYYLVLQVPGATFITDGVIPGDTLQMPLDCESDPGDWDDLTNLQEWEVNAILSQERIEVRNEGTNSSTVANELPHLKKRSLVPPLTGVLEDVTNGDIFFRIMRDMDKTEQVTSMVAVATSFTSKRLVLAYPDSVDISGLVDGSKPRYGSNTPAEADPQPGYYLACAIGGQTAGQPSQQGFTNLGISGISKLYNSSTYFNEQQLTDLSNGGVYVFIQDNPASLPYSVHEVTTDTTALETGEYMVVKNFDFIAWTFLDTLFPFLGIWNVTPETIEFIRQAIRTTIEALRARYVSKIGPPLVDAVIDGVEESDLSTDRIEAYVSVDLPMVLNTIGLHLVA